MELKEFIATGILESYLLGTATQQEIGKVHDMLNKYPYLKIEIDAVEEALLKVAESKRRTVSDSLKDKIFSSIDFDQPPSSSINTNNTYSTTKVPIRSSKKKMYISYSIAASIILLIASTVININILRTNKKMSNELSRLSKENIHMQSEMQSQKTMLDKMNSQFAALTDPNSKTIVLKGLDISPGSLATVYWNTRSNKVYLYANNLIDPPPNKQYQLWAIIDGKPVDAGVFETGEKQMLQNMKLASNPQAFAITLEKKGGNPTPTLEAMYLLGEV